MDSRVSENKGSRPLRRSTRQSSGTVKVLTVEPTIRGPLKRTRKELKKQALVPAVNGSGDVETDSDDDDSPSKKSRAETGDESGDEKEMDVQESVEDLENNEDLEMDNIQDASYGTHQPTTYHGNRGDIHLSPRVDLGVRHRSSLAENEESDWMKTKSVKPSTKEPVAPTKSATQIRPSAKRHDGLVTSMADYKRKMEAKTTGIQTVNHHVPRVYPASEKSYTTRQGFINIPKQKETARYKKQGIKKTAVIKKSSGYSNRGFIWCSWYLVLLVLLCSTLLLACKIIPILKKTADGGTHPSRAVKPEIFADHLSLLETQFPNQRPELWRMSKIHLERHLQKAEPTEPVSLIFTAGRRAERTLHCLAQRLAASFSSALNASVLHIDGASKSSQDSDEVKLDIDSQLRAAFEGNQPVAIIHRFEELPPGSTLIFYRYCDHENAAFKRVFLLFTVLLPQDEVKGDQSLKDLEEMVHDYVKERLVDTSNQASFNDMDNDKYGGLWSRISHLILPVVSEKEVEQKGC
ncbi:torsin-1A-interacting protein 2-like [Cyclopterus lumpus]|uniref:Torsin-1A-interacting protein 1/2 AAA+ activator domain-containing protein n=1 Tax=Cyclopterus lumpus TaxID=8103 RepID=A0A8C3G0G2_CYCLU|nr:torsin-1A-interacting protein 2-like [Cyclopterus lumpus]